MTLAAIYNVWDTEYLLGKSIAQIYDHVDSVVIVWQEVSNFGEVNPSVGQAVAELTKLPKVTLVEYQPDLKTSGSANETSKRSIGLQVARQQECTHFLFMDCDEFYVTKEFAKAKKWFTDNSLDTSYCQLDTYFKEPCYKLQPRENYFVPFICTVDVKHVGKGFKVYADPTRGVTPWGICMEAPITMHHMSYVRKDFRQKLSNSSARGHIKDLDKRLLEIEHWQYGQRHPWMPHDIVKVESLFPI